MNQIKEKKIINLFCYLLLIIIIILICFFQLFPHYYAWKNTPQESFFSGQASWFDPWDINVYVAPIRWGQQGHFLLKNFYTTVDHSPALFYPLYTLAGNLMPSLNSFFIFYFLSFIFGSVLSLTIFLISKYFLKSNFFALLALFLISFGGGIGWFLDGYFKSADLYITAFTFNSAFQRGHEAIGVTLYLSALTTLYLFIKKAKIKYNYYSLFSLLFLVIFYPYYLLSFALIGIIFLLWVKKYKNKKIVLSFLFNIGLITILTLIYYFHLKSTGFASVASQKLENLNLIAIFTGYGVFLPLFIYSYLKIKNHDQEKFFLLTWFVVSVCLSFLPLGIARFYFRSLFFPLILTSLIFFKQLSQKYFRLSLMIIIILVLVAPLSNFYIFSRRIESIYENNAWFYQSSAVEEGFDYLKNQSKDGVLASYVIANSIPAQTGKSVYFGHMIQTPMSGDKREKIGKFYANDLNEQQALEFLKVNKINYVFYSAEEQKLGEPKYSFLEETYSEGSVKIFTYD